MTMLNLKQLYSLSSMFYTILWMFFFSFIIHSSQAQTIEEVIKDKIEKGKESGSIIVDGVKLYVQDSMPTY